MKKPNEKGPCLTRLDDHLAKLARYPEYQVWLDAVGLAYDFNQMLLLARRHADQLDQLERQREAKRNQARLTNSAVEMHQALTAIRDNQECRCWNDEKHDQDCAFRRVVDVLAKIETSE
jgi:hypothetical protein